MSDSEFVLLCFLIGLFGGGIWTAAMLINSKLADIRAELRRR